METTEVVIILMRSERERERERTYRGNIEQENNKARKNIRVIKRVITTFGTLMRCVCERKREREGETEIL